MSAVPCRMPLCLSSTRKTVARCSVAATSSTPGSGVYLGIIQGRYVFDTSGKYAGTLDGDRVVYRTVDSARIASPTIAAPRVGLAVARAVPAAILGEEPPFPN